MFASSNFLLSAWSFRLILQGQLGRDTSCSLSQQDQSICLTDPGFPVDILVTADIGTFYQVWLGLMTFGDALHQQHIEIERGPHWPKPFPLGFSIAMRQRLCAPG